MESLLYLAHRIPYPPTKGDKIRSYHVLRFLAKRYRVYLGAFVDDPNDLEHLDALREWCADVHLVPIDPRLAKLKSLVGLATGEALTLPYYRHPSLQAWVERTLRQQSIQKAVVFSAVMTQYLAHASQVRLVADYCDVDSAKWMQYADEHRWPASWIYGREGRRLLAFEREAAQRSVACVFATRAECMLFERLAPECAGQTHAIENGVDTDRFAPDALRASPYAAGEAPIVFTGAMDYWPNIDAVTWFAREAWPLLLNERPDARFVIVGMNPAPAVQALARECPKVTVTGRVPDVRPYLQHARAVVAPLRVARGIQNKVLEAMAMARPVVVSSAAAHGISAQLGTDFESAADATGYVRKLVPLLDPETGDAMGQRGRASVRANYDWDRNLARFETLLEAPEANALSTMLTR
ncbi:MAG TPA: TIGR03087 family PEP-CTERM/XrtA system glycosyltransferase [Burkholderiaceae bacterium]|nr:TIGR03087 family PEP-CTERM/XrtA system glycosyltransferase [Burkholderiaceae bacterium]